MDHVGGCHLASRHAGGARRGNENDGDHKSLNFKVSPAFKTEFKVFAASQGVSMTALLKEGFALAKQKRKRS